MTLEDALKEFCRVFRMRKEGKLPPVDLRVSCGKCGTQLIGDQRVDFVKGELICIPCMGIELEKVKG
jgi:formylmethanofuran dehydrogenase subunit E